MSETILMHGKHRGIQFELCNDAKLQLKNGDTVTLSRTEAQTVYSILKDWLHPQKEDKLPR